MRKSSVSSISWRLIGQSEERALGVAMQRSLTGPLKKEFDLRIWSPRRTAEEEWD